MAAQHPSDFHPALTTERLVSVGEMIRRGRAEAVEQHAPELGDDGWTLGCRAYKFCCYRIEEGSISGDGVNWLTVQDSSLRFMFSIGGVPFRFYRGDADGPPSKTCKVSYPELSQLAMTFMGSNQDFAYRIAVETDFDGSVLTVKFVVLSDEKPIFTWEIPDTGSTVISSFPPVGTGSDGIDLPAPFVDFPDADDEKIAKGFS